MPRPRRSRAVLVGGADYQPSWAPRTNLTTTNDVWPTATTLASYRIGLHAYQLMYADQEGRCAICRAEKDPTRLVIDHNHKTGKIRGLLCGACNTGIGLLKDSPDVLEAAMQYLEDRGCGPDALKDDR